ncbi:AraC family transcriptional regulator [Streptomyces turgidiscabies]|uniref:Toxin-antitoxin system, antitoxin component, Xre family n=1 Tax=Streptomyces turgidiscabies (strain Car8) TaxID=698760 RepID=L7F237_STRT8|nr:MULTISPECIES: AraC family transcriptional regulator [Streptomyces]ELP65214.1 toxin-antitoxin system, antitoxin component, Xre family [Streptomyces turgidiscabies Car8]MDX3498624.1 AraC family transcriptional regulator [Streptomyces turgidiscabies]GAQ73580.1 virulence regulon transcriptional activator [Streptomyces turgidiscabies]
MAGSVERARHWRYAELPGVDLLRARYIHKTFVRHTHENFVIAAITEGVEVFHHREADQYAGPGALALVNPDTPHTGRAGVPEGWRYGAVYPAPEVVAEIAAETTVIRGTPGFLAPVFDDPYSVTLVHEVLRAAEEGNALAADTLLRVVVTRLLRLNGGALQERVVRTAGGRIAARARAVLEETMAGPPTLEKLATDLGTSPFALLRAFRDTYGLPPHAWLTDARVRRARRLLDAGTLPADAAVAVGFTDQPHLNRHFTRIVGVPPGAYQRERKNVQDPSGHLLLSSDGWQNRQLAQTYTPTTQASRTPPSYETPSESGSPSDCPVSPSE